MNLLILLVVVAIFGGFWKFGIWLMEFKGLLACFVLMYFCSLLIVSGMVIELLIIEFANMQMKFCVYIQISIFLFFFF